MQQISPTNPYSFGFTAASLRPELIGVMVELFAEHGSWEKTREVVLDTNALQCRSSASGIRLERELRQRLEMLTPEQLSLLGQGTHETRVALAWLAAVKRHAFLFEFVAGCLRDKLQLQDEILRASDWENYVEEKAAGHPEVESLSDTTRGKIRRVLLRMLREIEILTDGPELGGLQRPVLPPEVEDVIRADGPHWLAAFLVPDSQI